MTYIVLLNWNGWEDTNNCIDSIYQNIRMDFKIILIDNFSTDDSVNKIEKYLEEKHIEFIYINQNNINKEINNQFVFIQNNGNYGFGKGINVALQYCIQMYDCNDIWLLNTDAIIEQNTLDTLKLKLYTNSNIGIVGSIIRYFDNPNVIQTIGGGIFYPLLGNGKLFYKNKNIDILKNINFEKEIKKLDYIMGASLLIKKEVLKDIGLFDEKFFLYAEELDLCRRAKKSGWIISVVNDSFIYHKDSASTKDKKDMFFYLINKSNAYYIKKHYGVLILYIAMVSNILINIISRNKRKYLKDTLKGYLDGCKIL